MQIVQLNDFKVGVVTGNDVNGEHQQSEEYTTDLGEISSDLDCHRLTEGDAEIENLQDTIIKKLAYVLLKL